MRRDLLANREAELELFDRMAAGQTQERILLLEGAGALGKTSLLAEFVRRCPAGICALPIDLKGSPGLHDVLACLVGAHAVERWPALSACLARLAGLAGDVAFDQVPSDDYDVAAVAALLSDVFDVDGLRDFCDYHPPFHRSLRSVVTNASLDEVIHAVVDFSRRQMLFPDLLLAVRQVNPAMVRHHAARLCPRPAGAPLPPASGLGSSELQAALAAPDDAGRATRRAELTRALFADLAAWPGRLVLILDTYEKAGAEVQDWLAGPCLAGVARTAHLLVVIAGRQVPHPSVEWQAACEFRLLPPVEDVDAWADYAQRRGWAVPRAWIEGFCAVARGNPGQMETMLLGAASYRGAR